jgi:nucleoside 2-deoxyribosyltransferase
VAYDSRAYRILIASPSDVSEEREIAVRVIQAWNDLHSQTRRVVLLPIRWETHTAPEYDTRPQEAINRAIVDDCDLLIGIFWTRIGTPTGIADSGTLEEIGRVANSSKPVMLYFSDVPASPTTIDLEQLRKLHDFKKKTFASALVENFKSQIEFRDKLSAQLELRVRDLQKVDGKHRPVPLKLEFAGTDHGLIGSSVDRSVTSLDVYDLEESLSNVAEDKFRALARRKVERRIDGAATTSVILGILNTESTGIRNLYIDLRISASSDAVRVSDSPPGTPNHGLWQEYFLAASGAEDGSSSDEPSAMVDPWQDGLRRDGAGWRMTCEWDALQPTRKRFLKPRIFVTAPAGGQVLFEARVYADSFVEPLVLTATLKLVIDKKQLDFSSIISDLDAFVAQETSRRTFKLA